MLMIALLQLSLSLIGLFCLQVTCSSQRFLENPLSVLFSKPKMDSDSPSVIRMKLGLGGCGQETMMLGPGLETLLLISPNYPGNYPEGVTCVCNISSPIGTKIVISCDEFNVPCGIDKMLISPTGDKNFGDAGAEACSPARGPMSAYKESTANYMSIKLMGANDSITFSTSTENPLLKRKFRCEINLMKPEKSRVSGRDYIPISTIQSTTAQPSKSNINEEIITDNTPPTSATARKYRKSSHSLVIFKILLPFLFQYFYTPKGLQSI